MYPAYQQGPLGKWAQAHRWAACQPKTPIHATYQAGSQPIIDLRPMELAVPHQLALESTFAPCLDIHVTLNELARAVLESLDCRINLVAQVVQYNLYCDGSYTPQTQPDSKKAGANQKVGWAFVIAAQFMPRIQEEAIIGLAAGPMIQSEMEQQGLQVQSAEASEAFALHQAVKWALAQAHGRKCAPVTMFYDCAGAGQPAPGLATPSSDTRTISTATRALVHYAESHGVHIRFTQVHSHQGHGLN